MTKSEELMQMLEEGVESVQDSKQYKKYLKTMAAFPTYSASNTMLIFNQRPDASLVCGYKTWANKFNRHVKKGEKAIRIFAPYKYKTKRSDAKSDDDEIEKTGFRAVNVFDISQTEGDPLPNAVNEKILDKSVPEYNRIFEVLKKELKFGISFEALEPDRKGCCSYLRQEICIQKGMPELQTLKTLLHEGAHSLLHNPQQECDDDFTKFVLEHQEIREVEAESVAFVVCAWLNLDTSEYSFPYVANWKNDGQFMQESLKRIQKTAEKFIHAIQTELYPELQEAMPSKNTKVPGDHPVPYYATNKKETRCRVSFSDGIPNEERRSKNA